MQIPHCPIPRACLYLLVWLYSALAGSFYWSLFPLQCTDSDVAFQKAQTWPVHIHLGFIVILAGLIFTVYSLDFFFYQYVCWYHIQLLVSKSYWLIFLLFLAMSWGTNCFTSDLIKSESLCRVITLLNLVK